MRGRAVAAALAAICAPLFLRFASGTGIADIGDDSVSYLALARFLAGTAGPLLTPWVGFQSHFPPLFPLALALTGGASNLAVAHGVVACFAVAAIFMVQRYAALRLGDAAGLAIAVAFLALPTAWVSMKGILSEPMYLFVSLLALHWHARRLEAGDARAGAWLVFGLLLAAAVLTRAAGLALVGAFAVQVAWRAVARRERPRARVLLALLPLAAFEALWIALRPSAGADGYARTGGAMVASWLQDPGLMLEVGSRTFFDGWVASFGGDAELPLLPLVVLGALGALAIAGSVRAALAHRLDGWYALASLAVTFGWVFGEGNTRRLLYPLVAILLLHAGEMVALAARRAGQWIVVAAFAFPALLCAPAVALVQQKSLDRAPVAPFAHSYAEITTYYTVVNRARAQALAARQIAVIGGLEALASLTPPGARVMWMRPEYVALLGKREGVPFYYDWSAARLAREIGRTHTQYIVAARLFKTDLHGRRGRPDAVLGSAAAYARPVFAATNAVTGGNEFVLFEVDRPALEAALVASAPR